MNEKHSNIDYEIIVRYFEGNASEEDRQIIEEWASLSDANRLEFDRLQRVWKESGRIMPFDPVEVDVQSGWQHLTDRLETAGHWDGATSKSTGKKGTVRQISAYLARAAAVFIFIFLAYYLYTTVWMQPEQISVLAVNSIETRDLPDGSIITLNKETEIIYPKKFKKNKREVKLNGEAFFEVDKNPEQPFIVETSAAIIRVLGTSFNVKARESDDYVEVIVDEGLVELAKLDNSASVTLAAGEKGMLDLSANTLEKIEVEDPNELYWKSKTLIFRNTEISVVIETLRVNYDVEIEIPVEKPIKCNITGIFEDYNIDEILERIAENCRLNISKVGDKYIVSESDS
jgi:ferric-dicitrate binding protein FerR (iron transport regulator)